MRKFMAFLAGLGFLAGSGLGQVTTGRILGLVLDQSNELAPRGHPTRFLNPAKVLLNQTNMNLEEPGASG